jgi:hypothetical protein
MSFMPKAKRRKEARGFGKSFTQKKFNEQEFMRAGIEFPKLFELWTCIVGLAQIASALTPKKAVNCWKEYWFMAASILGQSNIAEAKHFFGLPRIKGVTLFALEETVNSLDRYSLLEFSLQTRTHYCSMAETTLELGLAFAAKTIIYAGKSITVYKGKDDSNGKGELMIAVKDSSGCWSHYPCNDNARVPLSYYKKAK